MSIVPITTEDGPCAHLVACARRGLAAVVDPDPSAFAGIADRLGSLGLNPVCVIETRLRPKRPPQEFQSLLSSLGLSQDLGRTPIGADRVGARLEGLPRVGPGARWKGEGASEDVRVLQVGSGAIEVSVRPRDDLGTFVFGEPAPLCLSFGRAQVRVGDLVLELVPVPERDDAWAVRVGDHLLTGAAVLAGTGVGLDHGTPPSLFALPDHHLVHAGVIVGGVGTSSVGAELRRATELGWRAPGSGARGWVPRVVEGEAGEPTGVPDPRGFRMLVPHDAWSVYERFLVVDVRDPRDVHESLPGARSLPMTALRGFAAETDADRPVLVVCENGTRSESAAALLARLGLRSVHQLLGGLELWREAQLPLRARHLPTALNDGN